LPASGRQRGVNLGGGFGVASGWLRGGFGGFGEFGRGGSGGAACVCVASGIDPRGAMRIRLSRRKSEANRLDLHAWTCTGDIGPRPPRNRHRITTRDTETNREPDDELR